MTSYTTTLWILQSSPDRTRPRAPGRTVPRPRADPVGCASLRIHPHAKTHLLEVLCLLTTAAVLAATAAAAVLVVTGVPATTNLLPVTRLTRSLTSRASRPPRTTRSCSSPERGYSTRSIDLTIERAGNQNLRCWRREAHFTYVDLTGLLMNTVPVISNPASSRRWRRSPHHLPRSSPGGRRGPGAGRSEVLSAPSSVRHLRARARLRGGGRLEFDLTC